MSDFSLLEREVKKRWLHSKKLNDMQQQLEIVPFEIDQAEVYWKHRILIRECIQKSFEHTKDTFEQMEQIMAFMEFHSNDVSVQIEGLRWVIEIFEFSPNKSTQNGCTTLQTVLIENNNLGKASSPKIPQCSPSSLSSLVTILQQHMHQPSVVAIIKQNRQYIGGTKAMKLFKNCISYNFEQVKKQWNAHCFDELSKNMPLGGIEGEAYQRNEIENYHNVSIMNNLRIHCSVLSIIEYFVRAKGQLTPETIVGEANFYLSDSVYFDSEPEPSLQDNAISSDHAHLVLSKCYWLMVNLSLIEETKKYLIDNHLIEYIVNSLQIYSSALYKELQYRACFALINLCIRGHAKKQVLKYCAIPLIIQAMNRFSNCYYFQKCCTNVIRSLCATHGYYTGAQKPIKIEDDYIICETIQKYEGTKALKKIKENFPTQSSLLSLANTTLHFIHLASQKNLEFFIAKKDFYVNIDKEILKKKQKRKGKKKKKNK
ncbi:hypothetical protein RFI_13004 [Reticulomyxa filosa]|uniref:Uncharacterized protein n=1 Tax=Reticulomyxa filosa TaxID=46433 RepID=X6NDS9_RETFI|nr:hypothetical protein RFI_13004 [Reticulomyxa filosa]|eukprot:ETO24156.1 hypothetical protein RFI_13004 [Reticulomyxa filosa]